MKFADFEEQIDHFVNELAGELPGQRRKDVETAVRKAASEIGSTDYRNQVRVAAMRILRESWNATPTSVIEAAFGAQTGPPSIKPGPAA